MIQVHIRASSFSTLLDCPARWHAQHILGMSFPSSAAAHLGTSIHASTAAFDQARIDGLEIKPYEAAGVFVDTLHDKNVDVDWKDAEFTPKQAESIGLTLHTRYCADVSPTQEYVAVEEGLPDLPVDFPGLDVRIVLTGHVDRIRRTEYGLGVGDLKSGKNAVKADGTVPIATHLAQLGAYELLTEAAIEQEITAPAAIYGMSTGAEQRVGIGEAASPKLLLLGSEDEPGLLEIAAKMFAHGLFYGNPRSQLCSSRYCPAFSNCKWRNHGK